MYEYAAYFIELLFGLYIHPIVSMVPESLDTDVGTRASGVRPSSRGFNEEVLGHRASSSLDKYPSMYAPHILLGSNNRFFFWYPEYKGVESF
jgi:hypothetical protein